LNIIPTDALSDELNPMSEGDINHDLDARLAMWTNFQFSNSSSAFSSSSSNNPNPNADADDEDQHSFSPERHTASRSRHKAITVDDFTSDHFFGNVGASLAHPVTSPPAEFHQHLHHDNITNANNNDMGDRNNIEQNQNSELFSFPPPGNLNLNSAVVDPFLNPADLTVGACGYGHGAQPLPPLTIREPWEDRLPHRHSQQHPTFPAHLPPMQMQGMQTIDPATTSLGHRVTPSVSRVLIPVDCEYAPNSAIGDDEMDHDRDDPYNPTGSPIYDEPSPPRLDASGKPIPYTPAEDKRRRNTLASARFRQKKKEREVAMHRKAKELDEHVSNLERECEILRKENKMLRGLLVDDAPAPNSATASTSTSTDNVDSSKSVGKNPVGVDAGASVVLLEELVRLLKANSAVLNNASEKAASTPPNGRTGTTGKRKRGAGN
jgi:Basic region leucine zipper